MYLDECMSMMLCLSGSPMFLCFTSASDEHQFLLLNNYHGLGGKKRKTKTNLPQQNSLENLSSSKSPLKIPQEQWSPTVFLEIYPSEDFLRGPIIIRPT